MIDGIPIRKSPTNKKILRSNEKELYIRSANPTITENMMKINNAMQLASLKILVFPCSSSAKKGCG